MASINNKFLIIIACAIALIGWVVALGGVAKINDVCNDTVDALDKYNSGNGMTHKVCSDALRYHWWGIWFGFFLTLVILVMAIMGKAAAWSSTLQAFCAACLSVSMIDANMAYTGSGYDAGDAALAGYILLSIGLMLIIIFLGMGSAGVNVSVSVAQNKTSPLSGNVERITPQPKTVDNV